MTEADTTVPEVKEEPTTEQTPAVAEPSIAELHQEKPKAEKPKVVPMARLDKEIQKRKELEARLAEYEATTEGEEDDETDVKKLAHELEQIKEKDRRAALEAVFTKHFNDALENAPEYKDIVNVEVIKAMAFNPENANKTYKQLLDEAYGNAVTGRRTIENATPRGGAKDTKVDMDRAQSDTEYRHMVLADPELKKQYNENLTDRVFR